MVKNAFDDFIVYEENKNHVFLNINLKDNEMFYTNLFEYFFPRMENLSKKRSEMERILRWRLYISIIRITKMTWIFGSNSQSVCLNCWIHMKLCLSKRTEMRYI